MRCAISSLAALAGLAPTAAPAAAAKPTTFAGSLGFTVPKGALGEVRAISRVGANVVAARTVGRSGRFSLSLPPGAYAVVGTVVPRHGRRAPRQRVLGVNLAARQRRTKASLKAPRRAKAKRSGARAAFVQERGQVTPGRIAVEIPRFTGATGEPPCHLADDLHGALRRRHPADLRPGVGGGEGFFNSGAITVTPKGVARKRG